MKCLLVSFLLLSTVRGISQPGIFVVHFPSNSAELSAEETGRLDSFIQSTQKIPLMIAGHTDSRGSDAFNIALSRRRVDAVKNYLMADGYSETLVNNNKAFGESMPVVNDEGNEEKGAANRRVEVFWQTVSAGALTVDTAESKAAPIAEEKFIRELIEDSTIRKGAVLSLNNIYFIGGRHRILPVSLPQLQSLYNAMKDNPKLKISVEGHICCLPGDADGLDFDTQTEDLSYQRAKAIYEYLVYSGIAEKRVKFKGLGHSIPLYPFLEKNEDEKTANRRVEVRILDK